MLNSNASSTCPHNMVNFGPLTAEICWRVWGIPANFIGFRVLAALLHGTRVVGVSQSLRCRTQGATYIRKDGHHVGHLPTFLVLLRPTARHFESYIMHASPQYVAYCYRPSNLVCRSVTVTIVSPAKTAEPIEMAFWMRIRVGSRNHVSLLD